MITASELGMLCARHRIKSASDLTEAVRSWFTPTPPEMNLTKDQKPQAQPNPYAKSSEQPFGATKGLPKGLPKGNPKQPITPFASGSAKAQEAAQAAARPQYDYFRPPTGHVKTQIIPYDHFKPLYDKYPGGYDKAIADAQRWQEHARLEGLHTWKPEDLHNPVDVRGGDYVKAWEERQTPFIATGRHGGFTDKNNPMNAGAYQNINMAGNGWSRNPNAIMMNPDKVDYPASNPWLRSILGHELTHAMHHNASNLLPRIGQDFSMTPSFGLPNVFKGHESKFPEHLSKPGGAGVGHSGEQDSRLDYLGRPTEFGAYLSELRRDWIANNPGKALDNIPAAEALLQHYNPARKVEAPRSFKITIPDNDITYNSAYPRSNINRGDLYKMLSPAARKRQQVVDQDFYEQDQKSFQDRKASGVPDGHKEITKFQPGNSKPVPNVSRFQELLPTIMSDPELKKRAILQILSSVVQNKQRQAPGTNV
jgi:hypothetical protein